MPDFIPVFIAATVSLLLLFLFFGGLITITEEPVQETAQPRPIYYDKIALGSNFTVADYGETYKLANLSGNVTSGLISEIDKTISFGASNRLDDFDQGKIWLDIKDTNLYGEFIIIINNNIVYRNATLVGEHEIRFSKDILNDENNILTVKAAGSGWRIWAPTVYIYDLKIYGEESEETTKTTSFNLTYVPSYARLRVYVYRREGDGYLKVKINGYNVYRGRSDGFKSFDPDILREGENTAEIIADPGTKYEVESVYITFE